MRRRAALFYPSLGWRVLPIWWVKDNGDCACPNESRTRIHENDPDDHSCNSPGKHPISAHGVHDATTDAARITAWWQQHPRAHVAIATGNGSGVVVLDVDPRNGGHDSLDALEEQLGRLPETTTADTGGGGQHLFFRCPTGGVELQAKPAPGIECQRDGQYVVAVPSGHESGGSYSWHGECAPDEIEPADLPEAWLEFLTRVDDDASGEPPPECDIPVGQREERARAYVAKMPTAISGEGGHDRTFAVACVLVRGFQLPLDNARQILTEYNQRCRPPWRERELEHKLTQAAARARIAWGYLLVDRDGNGSTASPPHLEDVPPPGEADDRYARDETVVLAPGNPMPNARLFLASEFAHPERCTLLCQGDQLYAWTGSCWPRLEKGALDSKLRLFFENKFFVDGTTLKPFAPTNRKVADLIGATSGITFLSTAIASPTWLDEDNPIAPPRELIACENGIVHWPTRTIYRHSPKFYVHFAVPFAFDSRSCPPKRWLAFLHELWEDNPDAIACLQELFGYFVSGDTSQQKLFLFVGPPRSGKGTIARVLTYLIGEPYVSGPTLASFATNFGLQDLIGKPLAIVSDARLGTRVDGSIVTERLLTISGEDTITIDRKNTTHWTGKLPTRVLILTNEVPRFSDASGALASRFIVLAFTNTFLGKENPTLTTELCEELPGIFNWALDGLDRLRKRGYFKQPRSSDDAVRDIQDLAAPISAFVRDCCQVRPTALVDRATLFDAYKSWSDERGYPRRNAALFGRDLRAAFPQVGRSQPRHGGTRGDLYTGIALQVSPNDQQADPGPHGFGRCMTCGAELPERVEIAECGVCRQARKEMDS